VLSLYSNYAGDSVIETETRVKLYDVHGGHVFAPEIVDVPYLDTLGTIDSGQGNLSLFVVNRDPLAKPFVCASIRLLA
jgi:hypothetical protein